MSSSSLTAGSGEGCVPERGQDAFDGVVAALGGVGVVGSEEAVCRLGPGGPVEGVVDVGAADPVGVAVVQSIVSQASSIVLVFRSWAWVRWAGVNPIQSLYRLLVRKIVGLP